MISVPDQLFRADMVFLLPDDHLHVLINLPTTLNGLTAVGIDIHRSGYMFLLH